MPEFSEFHMALGILGGGHIGGVAECELDACQRGVWGGRLGDYGSTGAETQIKELERESVG